MMRASKITSKISPVSGSFHFTDQSRSEDRRRSCLKAVLWLITLVVTQHLVMHPQTAFAQIPGAQNSERVDPLTGKLSLQIPLRGYPGRAGNSQAVNIRYASKVWE